MYGHQEGTVDEQTIREHAVYEEAIEGVATALRAAGLREVEVVPGEIHVRVAPYAVRLVPAEIRHEGVTAPPPRPTSLGEQRERQLLSTKLVELSRHAGAPHPQLNLEGIEHSTLQGLRLLITRAVEAFDERAASR